MPIAEFILCLRRCLKESKFAVKYSFRSELNKLPDVVKQSLIAQFLQNIFNVCADVCYTEVYGSQSQEDGIEVVFQ